MSLSPYWSGDGVEIYHGDCREIAPLLSWDCVLSDPPYGISYNHDPDYQSKHVESHRGNKDLVFGDDEPFDPSLWTDVPFILWGANNYASRLPDLRVWLCWDKVTRNGLNLRIAEGEFAASNCVGRTQIFRHLWSGGYRATERGEFYHPTQKPLSLMKWCLGLSGFPKSGLILDPFLGSGTTLVAARDCGRKAIGIEIEERYCEIAAKRLSQRVLF